jgi:hypothetical protein
LIGNYFGFGEAKAGELAKETRQFVIAHRVTNGAWVPYYLRKAHLSAGCCLVDAGLKKLIKRLSCQEFKQDSLADASFVLLEGFFILRLGYKWLNCRFL